MLQGIDYLGGANYLDLILREHPDGAAAGFILNTNKPHWRKANAWPAINGLFPTGRCPAQRLHAVWEDNHQYNPSKHDKIIFAEFERTNLLQEQNPLEQVYFSPFCELDTRGASVTKLFDRLVKGKHKDLIIVNSVSAGAIQKGLVNEVHGKHKNPGGKVIYSTDGSQCWDIDIQKRKKDFSNALLFMFWVSMCNGKWNDKARNEKGADTTPRPDRRAWPTVNQLDSIIYQFKDPGAVSLDRKHIWKSHADQHGPKPTPREGKPVFITPVDAKEVRLIADNGQVVAVMPRAGNYTDGRPLYRLNEFGYLVGLKARRIHGKETVKLVANGKVVGVVNPGFRAGEFR